MTETDEATKQNTINSLLDGEYLLVHIRTQAENLEIPTNLMNNPTVTLKLSKLFQGAMTISEEKIAADLIFGGSYFTCQIPFDAIWGATSDNGKTLFWPASAPKEVLEAMMTYPTATTIREEQTCEGKEKQQQNTTKETKPKKVSYLKRVK